MHGHYRQAITIPCVICKQHIALSVDLEDLKRHTEDGVFVQDAFVEPDGKPYLTPAERELFISGMCGTCWDALIPADPLAFN